MPWFNNTERFLFDIWKMHIHVLYELNCLLLTINKEGLIRYVCINETAGTISLSIPGVILRDISE